MSDKLQQIKEKSSIPTRRRIGVADVKIAAGLIADKLIASWGCDNATKIAHAVWQQLKAEKKRRKGDE